MSLIDKFRFYPQSLLLRWKIAAARSLLQGSYRWDALDELGIPGHGSDLIRVDFPPARDAAPRWGVEGRTVHPALAALFASNAPAQLELLRACLTHAETCHAWPVDEDASQPALPWRKNLFLTVLDQATLYGMLRQIQPERYLEIGSGMSTRVAWQARRDGRFPMEIVSVDPEPRYDIAALCDHVYRQRLEDIAPTLPAMITPRTVVFYDGSHRCLPASDVTVFFLELLPMLPSGAMVHIHDVYLPADYPAATFCRFWSEQYILAAYLLGGARGIEITLPCAHLTGQPAARSLIEAALGSESLAAGSSSFWFRRT
jgi:hypothetical protein